MTKEESDDLRNELRSLRDSPAIGLLEYGADPIIARRVGRMIVDAVERSKAEHRSQGKQWTKF